MSDTYRAMCAELLKALESWSPGGGGPLEDADEIAEANLMHRARVLLTQPEPTELTNDELLEIRDGAYCPGADEVNDEDDSMWKYTSNYISWLYDQGTVEEQQQYEAKGLRAVFNAGRRTRLP